ncbi:hypothetical protein [Burkholderia stagnalis]|uniref:hypothetical protein n=1 Tax=Burkholderia stagnalis TaxID=1503054 RepID=UPI0009C0D8F0|nr:hypothetical protein [Burkholderia stagnalis]
MKRSILCLCVVLAGCATVHESYAPDGRKAYTLNCSGLARGWDKCFQAAGELCNSAGYDVIDRTGEDASTIGGGASPGGVGFFGAHTQERAMVIACKRQTS